MNIKSIKKKIKHCCFREAYKELMDNHYIFNVHNLTEDFGSIDTITMYLFMMYAISQDEDVEKHIIICHFLFFGKPYIEGDDDLIYWHLKRALELSPYDSRILENWVFGVYSANPDCPFCKDELEDFKKHYMNCENTEI